jgi:D-alanyl-D-alanine carboxypeptidase
MRHRIIASSIVLALLLPIYPADALHKVEKQVTASALAKPGLFVMESSTGRVLAESAPDSARIPASVLKLITATVAIQTLGADRQYQTSIWQTEEANTYLIRGSLDPFLSSNKSISDKYGHGFITGLINRANESGARKLKIYYEGLFERDVIDLKLALKTNKKVTANFEKVSSEKATDLGTAEIQRITSVPLSEMVSHLVLWSDNRVADRLANAAARSIGESTKGRGLTATFKETLASLEISNAGLVIRDGSGLSKENQVSARTIVELLTKIRNDVRFISIYAGLPIAGKTGTLKNRFEKAPGAIGQVRAKTGWVNNSVTLAGYATSGEKEYAFAILADGITPTLKSRNAARRAMDRLLETIVMGDH